MNEIGLLCSAAVLPGSAFATELVRSNYQGVMESMPHTRNFTEIQLEFYVDNEYKSLKFFVSNKKITNIANLGTEFYVFIDFLPLSLL